MSPNRTKHRAQYAALGQACARAHEGLDQWAGVESAERSNGKIIARVKVMQLVKSRGMSALERRSDALIESDLEVPVT